MSCPETKALIDAYVDGELDLMRSIELEHHLNECPACASFHKARRSVQQVVRNDMLRYQSPDALKKRVLSAVAAQNRKERKPAWSWTALQWPVATVGVAAILLIAALWLRPAPNVVEREVFDSHVRSLMTGHLTDVLSTDQHTVKPWFAGKVDFSPPVRDFSAEGFPLVGGRIDYINDHAVAAIVYHRNQHVINALVWPVQAPDHGFRNVVERGYHAIATVRGGIEVWIVSDLNTDELARFAKLFVSSSAL